MYIFLTMEKVTLVLLGLGIDIAAFSLYEQSVLFMLCNIFYIITNFIFIYIMYRIILKFIKWLI